MFTTDDAPASSEGSEGYDTDDAGPTFVWGTNISDVFDYDPDLYTKMVRYPLEVLAIFDIVLMNMVGQINPLFENHIQTRIFNLKSSTSMRNLNPSGQITEPKICLKEECQAMDSMTLVHN
ncbi:DNA replication licensing factor MCM4-like [Quercus robur]|uniref:DNA replication licensing factor MCM4-like n=1 Tax=Quercus robur TaxID=38942 RepID=UPI0021627AAF|nr:DNA replication licensing factor MCM4-like [Quercus robur]